MQLLFIIAQYLLPHHLLSRLVGRIAASRTPWVKNTFIDWFIKRYGVDMSEAAEPDPRAYASFNEFFTRPLRDGARPLDPDPRAVLCPSDGVISQVGHITAGSILQAKGHSYTTRELLGGKAELAEQFADGAFATMYLSPKDYHRVHMPVDGRLTGTLYVPGQLFSVNQQTADNVPNLFARNERLVCLFDTPHGPMAMVLVGAMIVAGIETVWAGQVAPPPRVPTWRSYEPAAPVELARGAEMGRFMLGSTVIILFARDVVQWRESLGPLSPVCMGESLGRFLEP
ncbi:MAG: archaetidylserine decarboxylase [Spongiibacteraceae bacterium]|nr:archaetidylserine decarboxylase [Spongiibacteraceae bacterium]